MNKNSVVTFTTEYGNKSPYTAALKGLLLTKNPSITIVDISNEIAFNDILTTSYLLKTSAFYFPKGTIHLVGVEFNIVKYKQILIYACHEMYFIAADNGLGTLLFRDKECSVYALKTEILQVNKVFPEKDIFPFIVSHLLSDKPIDQIAVKASTQTERATLSPVIQGNMIKGSVIFIDGYENVITDITRKEFDMMQLKYSGFELLYRRKSGIRKISESYEEDRSGDTIALFNSFGYLEIAIKQGNAKSLLGLEPGNNVIIEFYD